MEAELRPGRHRLKQVEHEKQVLEQLDVKSQEAQQETGSAIRVTGGEGSVRERTPIQGVKGCVLRSLDCRAGLIKPSGYRSAIQVTSL